MILSYTLDNLLVSGEPLKVGIIKAESFIGESQSQQVLSSMRKASSSGYDILVAPEYSFSLSYCGPLSDSQLQQYLEEFKQLSAAKDLLFIPGTFLWEQEQKLRNSSVVFYDGKIIHQQDKIRNGGEVAIAGSYELQYQPGSDLQTFEWKELKIGIEICADVGSLAEAGVADADLVFLVSSGESNLPESMKAVHKNGYGVLADGLNQLYFAGNQGQVEQRWRALKERRMA